MLGKSKAIYLATRKKHDLLFNIYFMRPIAAGVVGVLAPTRVTPNQITILNLLIFVCSIALLIALPTWQGGLVAVGVLELSYLFDCVDGMLARHKKLASKEGHLFDFFTDEIKAVLLAGALGVRLYRAGGFGPTLHLPFVDRWPAESPLFLFAATAGSIILASAISLTNFVRRPEISGKETTVEAYYETMETTQRRSIVGWVAWAVMTFLRFLGHYPSHLWAFALADRLDGFFWIYLAINLLYLGRGWLGLFLRFGRF